MGNLVLTYREGVAVLRVTCACGATVYLLILEPHGQCHRCGVELDPDATEVVPSGRA